MTSALKNWSSIKRMFRLFKLICVIKTANDHASADLVQLIIFHRVLFRSFLSEEDKLINSFHICFELNATHAGLSHLFWHLNGYIKKNFVTLLCFVRMYWSSALSWFIIPSVNIDIEKI